MASSYSYSNSSKHPPRIGKTEFEILKESHRFLRDEEAKDGLSWDEQLAAKYYSSLYREFAVCDLKHYKSGNFALRWRTEDEVLFGTGETTCGNTRCEHHSISDHLLHDHNPTTPSLTTLELPFAYTEDGENKTALVKVVLCPRCLDKLMYKRRKERKMAELAEGVGTSAAISMENEVGSPGGALQEKNKRYDSQMETVDPQREERRSSRRSREERERRRSSRSLSPRRRKERRDKAT